MIELETERQAEAVGAFHMLAPTFSGTVAGKLSAAPRARQGVALLTNAARVSPATRAVVAELSKQLQARGMASLHIEGRWSSAAYDYAEDVVAAVQALRAQGVERVVLIAWPDAAPTGPLPELINDLVSSLLSRLKLRRRFGAVDDASASELKRRLQELVTTLCTVNEALVASAILLDGSQSPELRPPANPAADSAGQATHDDGLSYTCDANTLILRTTEAGPQETHALVHRLYAWSVEMLDATLPPAADESHESERFDGRVQVAGLAAKRSVTPEAQRTRALAQAVWRRLDQQWEGILNAFTARDTRGADQALQAIRASSRLTSAAPYQALTQARHAWKYLDYQARNDWLRVCHAAFDALSMRVEGERGSEDLAG